MNRILREIIGTFITVLIASAVFAHAAKSYTMPHDMHILMAMSVDQLPYIKVNL